MFSNKIICFILAVASLDYCSLVSADRVVMTNTGPVQGITINLQESEVEAFLGIPYAEPPLGRLRFLKPVPKSPWLGVYDASKKSPPCIQNVTERLYYMPITDNMTEDCLYLNIWVPTPNAKQLKPIIIYFYGGAFNIGSSDMDVYDGATLANYGNVIVATLNYRVGVLGFLTAFIEEADGNMGVYDQILALKWIKSNAVSFGGDPDQITLMGESAGAMSIAAFLLSPLTKDLFKRAILESGAAVHPLSNNNNERLLETSQKLAKYVGCADNNVTIKSDPKLVVKCLKRLPAFELSRAEGLIMKTNHITFYPRTLDEFMPKSPITLLREGNFKKTELLMGFNKNEGSFFLTSVLPQYFGFYGENDVQTITKRLAYHLIRMMFKFTEQTEEAEIANFYINTIKNGTSEKYTSAICNSLGDYMVTCNALFHADLHAASKNPVYFYVFTHRPESTVLSKWMGTTHFDEIQYVFGNPLYGLKNFSAEEAKFSRRIMDRWLAFAKTGDPNIPGELKWPVYTYEDPEYLDIDIEEMVRRRPDHYRCEFWRNRFYAEINKAKFSLLKSFAIATTRPDYTTMYLIILFCILKWRVNF